MKLFTVTKSVTISYGHRVPSHKSKCHNSHGHGGKIEVMVEGPLVVEGNKDSSEGMVIDFSDIKTALTEVGAFFDHRFVVAASDDEFKKVVNRALVPDSIARLEIGNQYYVNGFGWVQELPSVPTAENLAFICYQCLVVRLNRGPIKVLSVRFWETETSMAEYSEVSRSAQMALREAEGSA